MADVDREAEKREAKEMAEAKKAAEKEVTDAAEKDWVRGGPDGPQKLNLPEPKDREDPPFTRGDDPLAAAAALAEASTGTTGSSPHAGEVAAKLREAHKEQAKKGGHPKAEHKPKAEHAEQKPAPAESKEQEQAAAKAEKAN